MDKKHTIGDVNAGFMIATAVLIDLFQGILTISVVLLPFTWFLSIVSFVMFPLWFALAGVKYGGGAGGRKLLIMLATVVAEITPFINGLPALTAGVVGTIIQTRFEDARRNTGGKVTPRTALSMARKMRMDRRRAEAAREGGPQA